MPNGRHEPSAIEHNPSKARREALSAILLLLLVLLILLLIAAATERTDILRFAGAIIGSGSVLAFQPRLSPPAWDGARTRRRPAGPGTGGAS